VLIVARGGGSLEDLMAFNEEIVLRAVAACSIPLISAVGHETDTTLIDFVSDRRAPTPTAAAEMAIPARADLLADLAQKAARLAGALAQVTRERRLRLMRAERELPDLPSLLGTGRQRLDDRGDRLAMALPHLLERRRAVLASYAGRLPDLPAVVAAARERARDRGGRLVLSLPNLVTIRRHALGLAEQRLQSGLRQAAGSVHQRAGRVLGRLTDSVPRAALREARARLEGTAARLDSVSPLAVLARGYALVTDAGGAPITQASGVKPGMKMRLRFADGEVRSTADGAKPGERQGQLPL
jgi:exodeoxyribonuclease VII large subunit